MKKQSFSKFQKLQFEVELAAAYYLPNEKGKYLSTGRVASKVAKAKADSPSTVTLENWLHNHKNQAGIVPEWFGGKTSGQVSKTELCEVLISKLSPICSEVEDLATDFRKLLQDWTHEHDEEALNELLRLEEDLDPAKHEQKQRRREELRSMLKSTLEARSPASEEDEAESDQQAA